MEKKDLLPEKKNHVLQFKIIENTDNSNKVLSVIEDNHLLEGKKISIHKYTWQRMVQKNGKYYWKDEEKSQEYYVFKSGEDIRCKISYFENSVFKISYTKPYTDRPFSCRASIIFSEN